MIRLNITGDETKVVSFDTTDVDEITLHVNNTQEVVVAFSDGTTASLEPDANGFVLISEGLPAELSDFTLVLSPDDSGLTPAVHDVDITDVSENDVENNVDTADTSVFSPEENGVYSYNVSVPGHSVTVIEVQGVNILRITSTTHTFTTSTTDMGIFTITLDSPVTFGETLGLMYEAVEPSEPMLVENFTPIKKAEKYNILVDSVHLKDVSNPNELFGILDESFEFTLTSTEGRVDWVGELYFKPMNIENITVVAPSLPGFIKTEDNVVDGEMVSIPLNVHNQTTFVVEMAGTSSTSPVMVGGLYVYACLVAEEVCTTPITLDADSNNLWIDASYIGTDSYAYGGLNKSGGAFVADDTADSTTMYLAIVNTVDEPILKEVTLEAYNAKSVTLSVFNGDEHLMDITKSVENDGDTVTFTFDDGIQANVTEIELVRRDGVTDPIKVTGLLEKACFTPEVLCESVIDDTNIDIYSDRIPISGTLPTTGDNLDLVTFSSDQSFEITAAPGAVSSTTYDATMYKSEIRFAEPGTVDRVTLHLKNQYGVPAPNPGPIRVSMEPDQDVFKFNYLGLSGNYITWEIEPSGTGDVTITDITVEVCAEPIPPEECPNPMTDMQNPYMSLTSNDTSPQPTTWWQALQGSGSKTTLPDGSSAVKLTIDIAAKDEPRVDEVAFHGTNVDVTMIITRNDGSSYKVFDDPDKTAYEDRTYFDFNGLGADEEDFGDKIELIFTKVDDNLPAEIWDLNLVLCFEPEDLCPDGVLVDSLTLKSDHMEGSHTYISDPESAVLDIPLNNGGDPVVFEVHVKEEDAPQPAAFYNVMLEVENALDVTMTLKNKDGTVVKVLHNVLEDDQDKLFENFQGVEGDLIEIEVTPVPGKNVILLKSTVYACAAKPPNECQLRDRRHKITLGTCESDEEISYQYCAGSCSDSSSDEVQLFPNENETEPSLTSKKNCDCCRGIPTSNRTAVPVTCGLPNGSTVQRTYYIQEFSGCSCEPCT